MIAGFCFLVKTSKYAPNRTKKVSNSVSTFESDYYSPNSSQDIDIQGVQMVNILFQIACKSTFV